MPRKRNTDSRVSSGEGAPDSSDNSDPAVRRSNRIAKNRERDQEKDEDAEPINETAIDRLRQMDHDLRTETKRQKLQLEESHIPSKADSSKMDGDSPKQTKKRTNSDPWENTSTNTGSLSLVQEMSKFSMGRDNDLKESGEETTGNEAREDGYDAIRNLAAARPPPVNSGYLPIPWTGRLGYGCLNTYLRSANSPIFTSRKCRLASIIDHRHPLRDPSKPEHQRTNRPDRSKKPDVALGVMFVQQLSLANVRDIVKMVRWNDKYGIKFMQLSSGMCPFASHSIHGYRLESFASGALAEAGKVIAELGHRVTTHPSQHTQLGSPREEVIAASIRDLEYHSEMLSLLKLPPQQDRDAVVVLYMGGTFGDKFATLARFRHNYTTRLLPAVRARLALENDDVSWSVHDLLPICEELSIPLVLDYHHHNIIFDSRSVREGTLDISAPVLADRITATWACNGITQEIHYSEARPGAVTPRERRKHANRVATLPPCPPGVDLLVVAKDNEQAVFDLMRTFKLPGFEKINDMIPHTREDEHRPSRKVPKKGKRKDSGEAADSDRYEDDGAEKTLSGANVIALEEVAMGGPLNRVYWPVGMEYWISAKKRLKKAK